MSWEELTEPRVESFRRLAGDRTMIGGCPLCLVRGFRFGFTKKGGIHVDCAGCGTVGFIPRVNLTWALAGCGEALGDKPFGELVEADGMLVKRAAVLLNRRDAWVPASASATGGPKRASFRWVVACFGCGSIGAHLRRDVRGRPFVICAKGCHTRIFFASDEPMSRWMGWSDILHEWGDGAWLDWFDRGREVWMAWQGEVPVAAEATEVTAKKVTKRENKS